MKFIKGRNNLSVTVFVPWDCDNNCKFCTSKKEYKKEKNFFKVLDAIEKLNNTDIQEFVFTGGEPFANMELLDDLISSIDSSKKIYINTSLPKFENIDDIIKYIDNESRICGINISRHADEFSKETLSNIVEDKVIQKITKPVRINCVNNVSLDLEKLISRWKPYYKNVTLNIRADYRYIENFNLRTANNVVSENLLGLNCDYLGANGCDVCYTQYFILYMNSVAKKGLNINYHRGLEQSSFRIGDNITYNDIIIKPDGNIYYDWDDKDEDIDSLFDSIRNPLIPVKKTIKKDKTEPGSSCGVGTCGATSSHKEPATPESSYEFSSCGPTRAYKKPTIVSMSSCGGSSC